MIKTAVKIALGVTVFWSVETVALPARICDRMVDTIMNWGDKHVGGPFTKGGGDEAAARQVLNDIFGKTNPIAAFLHVVGGTPTSSGTPEQDSPGYSQKHGVAMPPGAHVQLLPQSPKSINPNPEIHPARSATDPPSRPNLDDFLDDDDVDSVPAPAAPSSIPNHDAHVPSHDHPDHSNPTDRSDSRLGTATADASVPGKATAGDSATHSHQILLEAGKTNLAQAQPDVSFHPSPEGATGSAAPPAAAPAAQPAPARAPPDHTGGGGSHSVTEHDHPTPSDHQRADAFEHYTKDS